jgi:hypothetical protein
MNKFQVYEERKVQQHQRRKAPMEEINPPEPIIWASSGKPIS